MSEGLRNASKASCESEFILPENWREVSLGDVVGRVVGGGTPARNKPEFWNGDIPWASVKDISSADLLLGDTEEHISEAGLRTSTANLIDAGIPVVATRMAVGAAALTSRATAINQDLKALYPTDVLNTQYFIRVLNALRPQLDAVAIGSTVKGIRLDQLLQSAFLLPPLPEQHRIAEILDTVDEAIQQTEALIAKLKEMRQGLLHDLLTRGLDENGELRDPVAHPEQFKDSPLGRIPKGWEVSRLARLLDAKVGIKPGPFGSSLIKDVYKKEGVKVYGQEQVIAGDLQVGEYYISPAKAVELSSFEVAEGDVLMSLVGTIGRVVVVRAPFEPGVINPRLIRLRRNPEVTNVDFLKHLLQSIPVIRQLESTAQGGTMPVLSASVLQRVEVGAPPLYEQRAIAVELDQYDLRIALERKHAEKMKLLKQGLMQDLLTGRARIPVPTHGSVAVNT